ncbi:unnamed protein product [Blepharisma stoltei]|uniref:Uncharacterized protein n=1 Tax=Blepharisma stoltei TaxID=1481888 RepID=A0AAU9JM25_9CILI|nr:unnamed protein product [Blepharisma stoltei]
MGNRIQRFCAQLIPPRKYILLAGVEGSGKTTVLFGPRLKPGWEQHHIEPTLGYNYEELRIDNNLLAVFDTPGKESLYPIVKSLTDNIYFGAIVFVFSISKEPMKYIEAKRKIRFLASEPSLKQCALAVIANISIDIEAQFKQVPFLTRALGLDELKSIDAQKKKLFVFDAKYSPKETEKVWRWIADTLDE